MINAAEARKITDIKIEDKKCLELKNVENSILSAIDAGDYSVTFETLSPEAREELEGLGYSVYKWATIWNVTWG